MILERPHTSREFDSCAVTGTGAASEPSTLGASSVVVSSVQVGQSGTGTVTLSTPSNGDTYAFGTSLATGTVFEVALDASEVTAGTDVTATVTYSPSAAGSDSDTLTVTWTRSGAVSR